MIKTRNLRAMDEEELEIRLRELKEELFNLRFQHATGQLDNPMKIKETRRDIARVCTVMTERKYSIHPEAFEEASRLPAFETVEEPEEMVEAETEAEELEEAEALAEEEIEIVESEEQLEEEVEDELRDI
jgi:large subunit ribosomal protein L29